MSVATAKRVLKDFLVSDKPEVLALKGAWGVGKTYAWNEALVSNKASISYERYCYVSLFGLSSMKELRTALFLKTEAVRTLGEKLSADTINENWLPLAKGGLRWAYSRFGALLKGIPHGSNISVGLEALAPHFVRDTIICLDDFERQKHLTPEDILGLISELKEEKHCKIALVFNESQLGAGRDDYLTYKEKVIDYEIEFDPTIDEASNLAFPVEFPERHQVVEHVRELGITNIRVLRKIKDCVTRTLGPLSGKHPGVLKETISSTILFCWCAYASDASKPDLADIANWNSKLLMPMLGKDEVLAEPQATQAKRLQTYGFSHVDDFDLALARVVDRGFLDETGFIEEAEKLDAMLRGQDKSDEFSKVWRRFHGTFSDDQSDFIAQLHTTARDSAEHIGNIDLNGTVSMLRQLSRDDLADSLIQHYIEVHKAKPTTFDLVGHPFGGSVDDPKLREAFDNAHAALVHLPTLSDAAYFMAKHSGYNPEHVEALKRATVDDFHTFFLGEHDFAMHPKLVKWCIQWTAPEHAEIGRRAREALERIKASSDLNAIRVRRFGL